jgi:hypothetical protein
MITEMPRLAQTYSRQIDKACASGGERILDGLGLKKKPLD